MRSLFFGEGSHITIGYLDVYLLSVLEGILRLEKCGLRGILTVAIQEVVFRIACFFIQPYKPTNVF